MVFLLNVSFAASKRVVSVLEPRDRTDGRAIAVFKLQREAAKGKETAAAFVEILEIFNIDDVFVREKLFVPRQVFIRDGVKTDHVEADALVVARDDLIHRRVVEAGIVAKVGVCSPVLVPAEVKEQKIRLFRVASIGEDTLKRDGLALV